MVPGKFPEMLLPIANRLTALLQRATPFGFQAVQLRLDAKDASHT